MDRLAVSTMFDCQYLGLYQDRTQYRVENISFICYCVLYIS